MNKVNLRGQVLVEAVIAMGIAALLVTGLIAGTTSSLKASQFSRNKSQASKLAQDGIEIARSLRDGGWDSFASYSNYPSNGAKFWCLDSNGTWTQLALGQECPANAGIIFSRKVSFNWSDPKMIVISKVTWPDSSTTHNSEITTYFTQWR